MHEQAAVAGRTYLGRVIPVELELDITQAGLEYDRLH